MSCERVSAKDSKAKAAGEASCAYRISLYIDVIILDSAWRTATSRPWPRSHRLTWPEHGHMARLGPS